MAKNQSAEAKAKRAAYDRLWRLAHPDFQPKYQQAYRAKKRIERAEKRATRAQQIRQTYRDLLASKLIAAAKLPLRS